MHVTRNMLHKDARLIGTLLCQFLFGMAEHFYLAGGCCLVSGTHL